MGGYGSGNRRKKHKATSDFPSIDIRLLQRKACLNTGHSHISELVYETHRESINIKTEYDWLIIDYHYRFGKNKVDHTNYTFKIDWMPCNYGGKRAFFLCPSCEQRVALLYCVNHFACRHCHDLTYACQGENAENRYARQANKIREKLGWKYGILNGMGSKPKGMHMETFEQLAGKEAWYASKVLDSLSKSFKK